MVSSIIDKLTTDSYRVLKNLYDNQIKVSDGSVFSPLTQREVADQIGVSKITMNTIFKELQRYDLIYHYQSSRGRYCLTDKALLIVKQIESLNYKLKNGK